MNEPLTAESLVSEDNLDAAWAEAEAAMVRHHGAAVTVGGTGRGDYYAHIVTPPPFPEHGEYGSTPTAALRALAARLSEGSGS